MAARRRALAVAAAVASAVAVWSWLRMPNPAPSAPATRGADAAPAIDPARRAAAIALARMPDDEPWQVAAAIAASSASAPKPTCGADERPRSGDASANDDAGPPSLARAAGPGYAAAVGRTDAALRESLDPFDQAVADWLNAGDVMTPAERHDALVQRAMETTDPRVYGLAYGACESFIAMRAGCQHRWVTPDARANARGDAMCAALAGERNDCDRLSARQWASLDPGNGVPWLYLFAEAAAAGEESGEQEALAQMAAATRFDTRERQAAGTVATHAPDDEAMLVAGADLTVKAIALAAAAPAPVTTLMQTCYQRAGGDTSRAQQCAAVGDAMFNRTDSIMLRRVGGGLWLQATGDPAKRDIAHAELVTMSQHWSPATGFSPCQEARAGLHFAIRSAQIGELEAARERARTFVPP